MPSLILSNRLYLNSNDNKRRFGDFLIKLNLVNASYLLRICAYRLILWCVALCMFPHRWNVTRSQVLSTVIIDKILRSGSLRIVRSTTLSIFDNADNISDDDGGTCSVEEIRIVPHPESRLSDIIVGYWLSGTRSLPAINIRGRTSPPEG